MPSLVKNNFVKWIENHWTQIIHLFITYIHIYLYFYLFLISIPISLEINSLETIDKELTCMIMEAEKICSHNLQTQSRSEV